MSDDRIIELNCPYAACGKETKQSLGRLRSNPVLVCPYCGQQIDVEPILKTFETKAQKVSRG
jgi:DNA-directed RNA polymerase subunit RPC12/RpoP